MSYMSTMPSEEEIQRIQLRIPNALYEEVKRLSENSFRTANAEILYLLSLGLDKMKETTSPEEVRQIVRDELARANK